MNGAGVFCGALEKSVADLIDEDDEVLGWVEGAAFADIGLLQNFRSARIPARKQDHVVFIFRERPVRGIGNFQPAQLHARTQCEIAGIENFIIAVNGGRIICFGHRNTPLLKHAALYADRVEILRV